MECHRGTRFRPDRGNVVHDTEHGGNRGLVAHRARRVGKHKTVGDDIGSVGQCHKGGQNRNNPQQHLEHAGKRQDTQDGDSAGAIVATGRSLAISARYGA